MSNRRKVLKNFHFIKYIAAAAVILLTGCPDPIVAPTTQDTGYFDVSLIIVGSDGYTKEVNFSETVASVTVEVENVIAAVDIELVEEVSGADIKVNNRSLDISSKVPVSLDTGSNEITVKVSPGSVDPFYYTLYIKRKLPNGEAFSSDATLSSLEISSVNNSVLHPSFSPNVFDYDSTVNFNVFEIGLTAIGSDDNSTIEIEGVEVESGTESEMIAIAEGSNTIEIVVTAENEITINNYSLTVFRASEADTVKPVITLVDGSPVYLEVFTAWTEPGYTAYDAVEGDLTSAVEVTGSVITDTVGFAGSFTYTVSDTSANATSATRHVYMEDNTAPVVTLNGANPMRVDKGGSYSDPGAAAVDEYDGDISGSIIISGDTVNPEIEGSYEVIYTSTDSSGNSTSKTRNVTVSNDNDSVPPVLTLLGDNPYEHEVNTAWSEPGYTAIDDVDGNLFSSVIITGSINISSLGTTTLDYNVSDSSGNAAVQQSRTVNVVDNTPPEITLIGASEITVPHGNVYTDPGVIVSDNYDTGLTATVTGNLFTDTVGTYFLRYDAEDSASNEADPKYRTVNVTDQTPPLITLHGSSAITIPLGGTFTDPYDIGNVTASDNVDGDITSSIVISGDIVDVNSTGTYYVFYDVSDNAGLEADRVTLTVTVGDETPPELTLNGSAFMTQEITDTYSEPGWTVTDNLDTDVDVSVSGSVIDHAAGTYTLTYTATDDAGNEDVEIRYVTVNADTEDPVLTLLGNGFMTIEIDEIYSEPGWLVSDNFDLEVEVSVTGSVINGAAGTYTLTYTATDDAGNEDVKTRYVTVNADAIDPVLTLNGNSSMAIEIDEIYSEPGWSVTDNFDTDVDVTVDGSVTNGMPGTYTLTYTATDDAGNEDVKTRTVTVNPESVPPVLTLSGSSSMTIEIHDTYVEPGWTVTDNFDTDVDVTVTGNVVNGNPGTYTLTYTAEDDSGNTDVETRQVTVNTDTDAPVLTLSGSSSITLEIHDIYSEPGWSVSDNFDTNVDVTVTGSVINGSPGTYTLTYTAEDDYGNTDVETRQVTVNTDTDDPVLTLLGSSSMTIEIHETYVEPGWNVSDNFDTNVNVTVDGSVTSGSPGTYTLTYTATDDYGNTDVETRQVTVNTDTDDPVLTLLGSSSMTIEIHEIYSEPGWNVTDNFDTDVNVTVTGSVTNGNPGTYTLTYTATDDSGNTDVETRQVTVNPDTEPPEITLNGAAEMTIPLGEPFNDPGVTITDNFDTGLTPVITGSVAVNEPGEYLLKYDAYDNAGNKALIPVYRSVTVATE